jgi:hypothetical protein
MVRESQYATYKGTSVGNALKQDENYLVHEIKKPHAWLVNEFNLLTRVDYMDLKDAKKPQQDVAEVEEVNLDNKSGIIEQVPPEEVMETLHENEIYRRAKARMAGVQNNQIAYGLRKYPEPLNSDTWTILQTIRHIQEEHVDALHYLTMLEIKLEQMLATDE